jgi:serine/threonine-protein kinase
MLDPSTQQDTWPSLEVAQQIDAVCDRFEAAWQSGARPRAEDYLDGVPADTIALLLSELLGVELHYRRAAGEAPTEAEYRERFPGQEAAVARAFGDESASRPPTIPGYEVLEPLGRGGMGVVYKARQRSLNRVVALKLLPAATHTGPQPATRFRTEAQAIARLQHPNIVQVYEAGEHEAVPFYSMEYVSGLSLARVLRDGPLPLRRAAECLEQVARAVHYAHQQGVVHRDLKPANILLSFSGDPEGSASDALPSGSPLNEAVPKIVDFGLAKAFGVGPDVTATGQVVGTPAYMAPEQLRGTANVGPASDVYGLGAVLYAALTGRPPFRGDTVYVILSQVGEREPEPPRRLNPGVPRDLETICLKCLEKEPERRYPTAQAVADDLRRWLKGEAPLAQPAGAVERAARWGRRNRLAAALLLALVVVLLAWLVTLVLLLSGYSRAPPGGPSSAANRRRPSSVWPAMRCASAFSTASHSSGVNGTASSGPGPSGTSRRTIAAHSPAMPAPVRAETWTAPAAPDRSQAAGRSALLTTRRTRCGDTSGQTGSAPASRTHRHRSAPATAPRARSTPCPSSASVS